MVSKMPGAVDEPNTPVWVPLVSRVERFVTDAMRLAIASSLSECEARALTLAVCERVEVVLS
jgi:hypothetical protein